MLRNEKSGLCRRDVIKLKRDADVIGLPAAMSAGSMNSTLSEPVSLQRSTSEVEESCVQPSEEQEIEWGIADFRAKLESSLTLDELETTWKEVVRSSIPATDKANLQKVKVAMTKKLKEVVIV
jgi:hypothetical protein